jgi:hypothetical protein
LPKRTLFELKVVAPVPPFATESAVPERPIVNVPEVVNGEPDILKKDGTAKAIDDIVPLVGSSHVIGAPAPPALVNICPTVPAVVGRL